jgi:phosphatidylglycerophosphate synthase
MVSGPALYRASVIDQSLRGAKDRALAPVVRLIGGRVHPTAITLVSMLSCVGAAFAAAQSSRWFALALWLVGRTLDGIDGPVARSTGRQSDLGGYLDMMADTVGYAAVPIGIAAARSSAPVWLACAVLLASFYLNTMSWTYLAAIAEKRAAGASARGEPTTIHMTTGLIEGTETIVLFAAMLLWPAQARGLFFVMAALVGVTIVQRLVWAKRQLA